MSHFLILSSNLQEIFPEDSWEIAFLVCFSCGFFAASEVKEDAGLTSAIPPNALVAIV